jgi:hypothetical protein
MFMPPPFERWHGIIQNHPPLPRKIGAKPVAGAMVAEIGGRLV